MLTRTVPSSGEALPLIGLGTYRGFDAGASAPERTALAEVLKTLVACGGKMVDSSPMYDRAEGVVGDLQAQLGLRPQLFLATKVWTSGRDAGIRQMQRSLQSMQAGTMDLMQIHNLVDVQTHTATLEEWKRQGKVRYLGITHYHEGAYGELERLIATRRYDFVQLNYCIVERAAEQRLLPLARETGVAVIVNRPFAQAGVFARARQGAPALGSRVRLQRLEPVLPEVRRLAPGGDLRDSRHQRTRAHAEQRDRRRRAPARRADAHAHGSLFRESVNAAGG